MLYNNITKGANIHSIIHTLQDSFQAVLKIWSILSFQRWTLERGRESISSGYNKHLSSRLSRIRSDRRYPNSRGVSCSALLAGTKRIGNRAAVSCGENRISLVSLSPLAGFADAHTASCTRLRPARYILTDQPVDRRVSSSLRRCSTDSYRRRISSYHLVEIDRATLSEDFNLA